MNADQTAAFDAFLLKDDELEESLELEGHVMLVAMQEAVIGAINA